jgi:polysaccharide biosynthesis/export protein
MNTADLLVHFAVKTARNFSILGVALILAGCATSGPKATTNPEAIIAKQSTENEHIKQFNQQIFSAVSSAPLDQEYVLGEGDLLQFSVFEAQELKGEVRVSARGDVTLPLVGAVSVKGTTVRDAEQKIENEYRKKYLHNPHVTVFVKERQGGKITLLGAVKKPGMQDYYGNQRVLDVLARAEGLSDKAGSMVQVRRSGKDPEHPVTVLIDLDKMVKTGHAELNIPIERGDVVFVPEAGMVYIDGAVHKPGTYPIKQSMTVQEAIVTAGGLLKTASDGDIKLIRLAGDGQREVTKLGMKDIMVGSADGIEVKDRDIIFVETNQITSFLYGFRPYLGNGLFGIGYSPPRE